MPLKSEARIFGVKIDRLSWAELDEFCRKSLLEDSPNHIVTANGEILLRAHDNKSYRDLLNSAELVITDSTNVSWVLALKGKPTSVTQGADLVNHLARIATETRSSIFLLGAKDGIALKAGDKLKKMNPGLRIAGTSSTNPDEVHTIKQIKDSGADIVLVAYGAPKQEEWIATHRNELGAKILVGIGGTFDMLAGVTPRAPYLLRALRLEWLWRLLLQPTRIGRIWRAVVIFPMKALIK
ncbi:MAG: WecB/TagA/CpsF family glycosyltransferase [Patescibacteria group bacterium]